MGSLLNQARFGKAGMNWAMFPALTTVVLVMMMMFLAHAMVVTFLVLAHAIVFSMAFTHTHAMVVVGLDLLMFFRRLQECQRPCITDMNRCKKEKSRTEKAHHLLS